MKVTGFTGLGQCAQKCGDWARGTTASTDGGGIWASLSVVQGGVWGCLVVGTKAKTCTTGTLIQRDKTLQDRPVLRSSKGGITKVVACVLPIHPIPSSLSPIHSWYSLRRIVPSLDASRAESKVLETASSSAAAFLMYNLSPSWAAISGVVPWSSYNFPSCNWSLRPRGIHTLFIP